jgi:thioredoxin reductase
VVVRLLLPTRRVSKTNDFEVAIVGGGPAGLSCGVWLGRYLHRTVLIDSGDPRNWETTGINGFLGLPRIRPPDLRRRGRTQCKRFGVKLVDGCVDRVCKKETDHFELVLDGGRRITSRRLMLSIGLRDTWPDLPGLEHCYGRSAHHCPDCDGYDARGKRTVVVGNGRKAVALALALSCWTSDLLILTNGAPPDFSSENFAKLDALNIPVIETQVTCAVAHERELVWLELDDGMLIDAQKLFFTVTHFPADDLGAQLGCARDEDGLILVDQSHRTSVEHVYAAGDITPGAQLAITAAADGAVAAGAIHRSLLPEVRRLS